jgi:hypothetical protein
MKFELALTELRKGKTIKLSSSDYTILNLEENLGYVLHASQLVGDDWEIIEEPGKTFPEVFEAFKEGKKIRRKSWEKGLSNAKDRTLHIWVEDILSTDWEIVE